MTQSLRKTKIICTIGPATCSEERLRALAEAGMNIARLNFSHGEYAWHAEVIRLVRKLNKEGFAIGIAADIQGPAIRTGDRKSPLAVKRGDKVVFTIKKTGDVPESYLTVDHKGMIKDLKVGSHIVLDNGLIELKVIQKKADQLTAQALDSGIVGNRRHVNLPGTDVSLPDLTEKDKKDIAFLAKQKVDFINLSFVRSAKVVRTVRKMVAQNGGACHLIAKIENQTGVNNFEEIMQEADGVMVARGDLGIEIPYEDVPVLQKQFVKKCIRAGKPVIVATQMLESMIQNPTPTRAEVSDVFNAVMQRASAVMLSGETTVGPYPVRCVEVMHRIALQAEKLLESSPYEAPASENIDEEMARLASSVAQSSGAKGILVFTKSGRTANLVTRCRPIVPVFAFTESNEVCSRMALTWGVHPHTVKFAENPEHTITSALAHLRSYKAVKKGDRLVILSDMLLGSERVDSTLQIYTIA